VDCYSLFYQLHFWGKSSENIEIIGKYNINPSDRKIISVSLYGTNPIYFNGALKIKDDIPVYFPGWQLRVYMHYQVDPKIMNDFLKKGVQLIIIKQDKVTPSDSTFWRFLAAQDDVIFISRDADYQLNKYDYSMTQNWIMNRKTKFFKYTFFSSVDFINPIIRKLFKLNNHFAAGRWGGRDKCVPDMLERINNFKKRNIWHSDEVFLQSIITNNYIKHQGITVYSEKESLKNIFNEVYIDFITVSSDYNTIKYDIKANNQKKLEKLLEYFENNLT